MQGANAPEGASIDPVTTLHQQLHTTIDTIPHIAPPDASDVRKIKNALPQTEPNHSSTRTNRKDPTLQHKGRAHAEFQNWLATITKIETTSPGEAGNGSDRQQRAEQPPSPKGDRVSKSRKRHHSCGEPLPGPPPHTISRSTELLDICTDAQYIVNHQTPPGRRVNNK